MASEKAPLDLDAGLELLDKLERKVVRRRGHLNHLLAEQRGGLNSPNAAKSSSPLMKTTLLWNDGDVVVHKEESKSKSKPKFKDDKNGKQMKKKTSLQAEHRKMSMEDAAYEARDDKRRLSKKRMGRVLVFIDSLQRDREEDDPLEVVGWLLVNVAGGESSRFHPKLQPVALSKKTKSNNRSMAKFVFSKGRTVMTGANNVLDKRNLVFGVVLYNMRLRHAASYTLKYVPNGDHERISSKISCLSHQLLRDVDLDEALDYNWKPLEIPASRASSPH
jgi:hypothetical protein